MSEPLVDLSWRQLISELSCRERRETCTADGVSDMDAFWSELERRLHSLCAKMASSRPGISEADREDIVQEILVKLQSKALLSRLGKTRKVEGYFFTMIRNRANDFARKRRVREQAIFYCDPHFGHVASHEARVAEMELLKKIGELLCECSKQEAEILTMRFQHELSIKEIAERTGRSYSSVAVRLFRLIRRLRADIREEYLQ